jgi:hypothetical protein
MVEEDDVQLVESIGGINGTPLASDVQSVNMHGFVGASSIITTSNPTVAAIASNFIEV